MKLNCTNYKDSLFLMETQSKEYESQNGYGRILKKSVALNADLT